MARRSQGRHRRNNYQHPISAKIGTKPLTIIYVDLQTSIKRSSGKLKAGDRIRWRSDNGPMAAYTDVLTGIIAPEFKPDGTLFISLH